jgi:hypothetical protein
MSAELVDVRLTQPADVRLTQPAVCIFFFASFIQNHHSHCSSECRYRNFQSKMEKEESGQKKKSPPYDLQKRKAMEESWIYEEDEPAGTAGEQDLGYDIHDLSG